MNNSPKYPRTFHFPFSEGATNDDKIANDISNVIGQPIIISEKCDGECSSLEADGCFARTHAHPSTHASADLLKAFHAAIKYKIPQGIQLFGENLFAVHAIAYSELPGYFLLFNVRDLNYQEPVWLSWSEVELWAEEIGVPTVPALFRGQVNSEDELKKLVESLMIEPSCCGGIREGVVVRVASAFVDNDFDKCVLKNVRKNHVSPDNEHWRHKEIVKNKLKSEK